MLDTITPTRHEPAILLFGHGGRGSDYLAPFVRILAALRALAPERKQYLAFLEISTPDFAQAIAQAVTDGVRHLRVVPIFFAPGKHVREDLPALIAQARGSYPALKIEVVATVGEGAAVVAAMAQHALASDIIDVAGEADR